MILMELEFFYRFLKKYVDIKFNESGSQVVAC
jgi:hypothetical protein